MKVHSTTLFAFALPVVLSLLVCGARAQDDCTVTHKGSERTFPNCKEVSPGFKVYWRVQGNRILTLLQAENDGYFAWAWGYDVMIGSQAMVVWRRGKTRAGAAKFQLNAKSPAKVVQVGKRAPSSFKDGVQTAMFGRKLVGSDLSVIRPGKVNFAIWSVGPPVKGGKLSRHTDMGVTSLKV